MNKNLFFIHLILKNEIFNYIYFIFKINLNFYLNNLYFKIFFFAFQQIIKNGN